MAASSSRALAFAVALTMATCSLAARDPLLAVPRYQVPEGGQDRFMSRLAFAKLFLVPLLLAYYFRNRRRAVPAQKKAAAQKLVPGNAKEVPEVASTRSEAQAWREMAAASPREEQECESASIASGSEHEGECQEIQVDGDVASQSFEKKSESPSTVSGREPEADSLDVHSDGDAAGSEAGEPTRDDSDMSLAQVLAFVPSVAWVEGDSTSRSLEGKSESPSMISGFGEPEADSLEVQAGGDDVVEATRSFEKTFESPSTISGGEPEADSLEVQVEGEDAEGSEATVAPLEPTEEEEEQKEEEEAEQPVVVMTLDSLRRRVEEVESMQERIARVLAATSAVPEDDAAISRTSTETQLPRASEAAALARHSKASSVRAVPRTADATPRTAGAAARKAPAPPRLAYTRRGTAPDLSQTLAVAETPKAMSARVPLTVRRNSFPSPMVSAPGTAAAAAPLRSVRTSSSRPSSQTPVAVGTPALRSHRSWKNITAGRVLSPTTAPSASVAYSSQRSSGGSALQGQAA